MPTPAPASAAAHSQSAAAVRNVPATQDDPMTLSDNFSAVKMEAVRQYIASNHIVPVVEEAINQVAKIRPQDCFGVMGDMLVEKYGGPPLIRSVLLQDSLDSIGNPAVTATIVGTLRGTSAIIGSMTASIIASSLQDMPVVTETLLGVQGKITSPVLNTVDKLNQEVQAAVTRIAPHLQKMFEGKTFDSLKEADKLLAAIPGVSSPIEKKVVFLVSMAFFSGMVLRYPRGLDKRFIKVLEQGTQAHLPKLVVPLLQTAPNAKLRIREVSIVVDASGISATKLCQALVGISRGLAAVLLAKLPSCLSADAPAGAAPTKGGKGATSRAATAAVGSGDSALVQTNDLGAYILPANATVKLEQIFEWLEEAMKGVDVDVGFALQLDPEAMTKTAPDMFELHAGQSVNPATYAEQLAAFCVEHPKLEILEQPFTKKHEKYWNETRERFVPHQQILFSQDYPAVYKHASVAFDRFPFASDALEAAIETRENGAKILLHHVCGNQDAVEYLKLARAISADYLKVGVPTRPEWLRLYNQAQMLNSLK